METERKDLEWIWRGVSLLVLPLLGWIIQLSADLSRAQVERHQSAQSPTNKVINLGSHDAL
jgi:hypothetical protein